MTSVDDYYKATWVYLLKSKSEVFSNFQLFNKLDETQFDIKLKVLRADNIGEHMSDVFSSDLYVYGISRQTDYLS